MSDPIVAADRPLLDHLRRRRSASVGELVELCGVTATAVRQRLTRLMDAGLVDRKAEGRGRGRPTHRYSLTEAGRRSCGDNYDQLAKVLWEEVRAVEEPAVRRGLLTRLAGRLTNLYRGRVQGETLQERMGSLVEYLADRDVPVEIDQSGGAPALTVLACPYPELAEVDRGVCAMEKQMFAEVLGEPLKLSACRLDGETCCTFEARASSDNPAPSNRNPATVS